MQADRWVRHGGKVIPLYAQPQQERKPLTAVQRREVIDRSGDKTDGLNQEDFAEEIIFAVERHHGITSAPKETPNGAK